MGDVSVSGTAAHDCPPPSRTVRTARVCLRRAVISDLPLSSLCVVLVGEPDAIQVSGRWIQVSGRWIQVSGRVDPGQWAVDPGHGRWIQVSGRWIQVSGRRIQVSGWVDSGSVQGKGDPPRRSEFWSEICSRGIKMLRLG